MKDFQDSLKSAYSLALRKLGKSAMTRKQIEIYLLKKGYMQSNVSQVIDKLSTDGYINDYEYADNAVRNVLQYNPKSKIMLSHELRLKGIDELVISTAMKSFDEDRQQEMANKLAGKHLVRYNSDSEEKIRLKISQMLYRKGFEWSVINKALKSINSED